MKGKLAIVAFVLAAAVIGIWAATGMHAATQTKQLVEVEDKDEFGDVVKRQEWKDGFQLGLLDGAAPAAGVLVGLGVVLLILQRRERAA